jgi:hypothetical protein
MADPVAGNGERGSTKSHHFLLSVHGVQRDGILLNPNRKY